MRTIETKLWLALSSRIATLTTAPAMTMVEPGQLYDPDGDPHILISDVRNEVDRGGRIDASLNTHSGTLMLQMRWPIASPVSHTQLVEIGGQIAAHFPADLSMQYGGVCARVTGDTTMLQPDVDGAYRVVIVRVPWSTT